MNQREFEEVATLHYRWLRGYSNGKQADFTNEYLLGLRLNFMELDKAIFNGACLHNTVARNVSFTNCIFINCRMDDFTAHSCNFSSANLSGASLICANLNTSKLNNTNLYNTNLFSLIGNGQQIKTINIDTYHINYTIDRMQIGCKNFSIDEWFNFSDKDIVAMDREALAWWHKWRDWIKQTIEISPAIK